MNKLITTVGGIGVAFILSACVGTNANKSLILPLDHGPRAQVTPWENQQRMPRFGQKDKAAPSKAFNDSTK